MHLSLPECTLLVHLAWVQCCECHREPQPPLTRPLHHPAGSRPSARLGAISKTNLQPKPASPCLSLLLSSSIPTNQPTSQPIRNQTKPTNLSETKPTNQPNQINQENPSPSSLCLSFSLYPGLLLHSLNKLSHGWVSS